MILVQIRKRLYIVGIRIDIRPVTSHPNLTLPGPSPPARTLIDPYAILLCRYHQNARHRPFGQTQCTRYKKVPISCAAGTAQIRHRGEA